MLLVYVQKIIMLQNASPQVNASSCLYCPCSYFTGLNKDIGLEDLVDDFTTFYTAGKPAKLSSWYDMPMMF